VDNSNLNYHYLYHFKQNIMLHTIKKLSVFAIVAIVAMAFSACSSDEEQPAVLQQPPGQGAACTPQLHWSQRQH